MNDDDLDQLARAAGPAARDPGRATREHFRRERQDRAALGAINWLAIPLGLLGAALAFVLARGC